MKLAATANAGRVLGEASDEHVAAQLGSFLVARLYTGRCQRSLPGSNPSRQSMVPSPKSPKLLEIRTSVASETDVLERQRSSLAYDFNGNTPSHHAAHDANAAE